MQCEVEEHADRLCVSGEMSIYTAAQLKVALFDRLAAHEGPCHLQLDAVTAFDSAGLQIVLLINRLAQATGRPFAVLAPSVAVRETLELVGLQGLINAGAAASPAPAVPPPAKKKGRSKS